MSSSEKLYTLVKVFPDTRPVLRRGFSDTIQKLTELYGEDKEAMDVALWPPSPERTRELGRELADMLIILLTIANTEGLDLFAYGIEKMMRNEAKYVVELLQEGGYKEQVALVKQRWAEMGGDEAYFKDKH